MIHEATGGARVAEAAKSWTNEAILAQGLDPKNYEIVAGELVERHAMSQVDGALWIELTSRLGPFVKEHRLGHLANIGRFLLSETPRTERRPDVAFVRRERLSEGPIPDLFPGPPDLAIEILSPTDTPLAAAQRAEDFLAAGAVEVWVVSRSFQCVTVFRAERPPRSYSPGDVLESPDLLAGFALPLAEFFGA